MYDPGKKLKILNRLKTFLKLSLLTILDPISFQILFFVALPLHHLLIMCVILLNFYFSSLFFVYETTNSESCKNESFS